MVPVVEAGKGRLSGRRVSSNAAGPAYFMMSCFVDADVMGQAPWGSSVDLRQRQLADKGSCSSLRRLRELAYSCSAEQRGTARRTTFQLAEFSSAVMDGRRLHASSALYWVIGELSSDYLYSTTRGSISRHIALCFHSALSLGAGDIWKYSWFIRTLRAGQFSRRLITLPCGSAACSGGT